MKILIFHASAGAGHRRAAEALYKAFLTQKGHQVVLNDALDYTDSFFKKTYAGGYEYAIRNLPSLWALAFYLCDSKLLKPIIFCLRTFINSLHSKKFEDYLEKERPDIVISTHFFPVEVISRMKRKGKANFKFICVVTDYNVHSFWISNLVDEYIVACDYTKEILAKLGIQKEKIKVLGIPIDPHFSLKADRILLGKKFALDSDKFSVLIIAGTFGIGPLKNIAGLLKSQDIQVIVGCGKNKKLFDELTSFAKKDRNLKPIGFVDYVDELMVLSNIIITKPGGLTISESLAMELPMIFISAIKGQETKNAKLMVDLGFAYYPHNIKEIPSIIEGLCSNPLSLNEIRSKIRLFAKPNSAEEIVSHILKS